VLGTCMARHTHVEWLKFLRLIDRQTPTDKQVHLIVDNYATHKHPKVRSRLARHKRFHVHFTPTSASWLNMVERFFRDLTENRLRRSAFRSVPELVSAIEGYIAGHNEQPKPFIWTAKATDILAKGDARPSSAQYCAIGVTHYTRSVRFMTSSCVGLLEYLARGAFEVWRRELALESLAKFACVAVPVVRNDPPETGSSVVDSKEVGARAQRQQFHVSTQEYACAPELCRVAAFRLGFPFDRNVVDWLLSTVAEQENQGLVKVFTNPETQLLVRSVLHDCIPYRGPCTRTTIRSRLNHQAASFMSYL